VKLQAKGKHVVVVLFEFQNGLAGFNVYREI